MYVGLFRNADSAAQYIKAVRWMYTYLNCEISWDSPKLKQSLRGGHKLQKAINASKPRPAIRWALLARMVDHAWGRGMFAFAAAYVVAANFLLRCRSELVDMKFDQLSFNTNVQPATVTLVLHSRKNMPHGASLTRKCICHSHPKLCPVHIFSRLATAARRSMVGKVFGFTYSSFQNTMRGHLSDLNVEHHQEYSTKAFRRGTAQEMVATGSSLAEVLSAGQWRSAAFLLYLRQADIEEDAVFAAFDQLSDDEDAGPTSAPKSVPRGPKRAGEIAFGIPSRSEKLSKPALSTAETPALPASVPLQSSPRDYIEDTRSSDRGSHKDEKYKKHKEKKNKKAKKDKKAKQASKDRTTINTGELPAGTGLEPDPESLRFASGDPSDTRGGAPRDQAEPSRDTDTHIWKDLQDIFCGDSPER